MSKCREAFDEYSPAFADEYRMWKAAWNAATQNAAEICKRSKELELAEAIEQEKEE